jgi:hypothetical protein
MCRGLWYSDSLDPQTAEPDPYKFEFRGLHTQTANVRLSHCYSESCKGWSIVASKADRTQHNHPDSKYARIERERRYLLRDLPEGCRD